MPRGRAPEAAVYDEILALVDKPVRYVGGEWNQVVKPASPGLARVAFAFPDSYEIGMSHLGLRILYDVLNRQPDIAAERAFCPMVDMEAQLRRFGLPLATLETRTPLADCDVVGFSLQFEMEYTNVLTMLDLGGIPLRGADRRPEDPLVVAGGPCVFSPEPMADFIDVFVIGDGEEAFPALVRRWMELRREGGRDREAMLVEMARLEGNYVPSLYRTTIDPETGFAIVTGPRPGFDVPFPIRRALVDDLGRWPYPTDTIVPYGEIVHDRVSVEIARGCTEGCRFCQAGIIYRPVRERSPADIVRAAAQGLRDTGYDEVSLTSLSTADYSCISTLVRRMMDEFERADVAMSVSSMRVYGLTKSIAEQLARVRRTGFTIAPEAGTQRLRDLINKGVTDADIDTAARIAWEQGWSQLKMYFMIGLPTETDADVEGIAATGIRVHELARAAGRRGARVTVSASSLVPKPHSTFQWEPMGDAADLRRKQRLILDGVRPHKAVTFKYHDVDEGVVECILSRGDRRLGAVIESAWRAGARFDAWSDHFDFERWLGCLAEAGLDPQIFLRRIPIHAALPWDHIDSRVTKPFLVEDLHRGLRGKFSPACEKPFIPRDPARPAKPLESAILVCYDCGLDCDLEAIKRERIAQRDSMAPGSTALAAAFRGERPPEAAPPPAIRLELRAANGDGLGTNAFEAASGIRHGEAANPGRDSAPVLLLPDRLPSRAADRPRRFYRVRFAKRGELRWLSHLDLLRLWQRAFKRAGVEVSYSRGFHPQPLFSFGPALGIGIESECERFDFESAEVLDPEAVHARLDAALPAGIRVLEVERIPKAGKSLSAMLDLGVYRAWPNAVRRALCPDEFAALPVAMQSDAAFHRGKIAAFLARDSWVVERRSKGSVKPVDVRPFVRALDWDVQRNELDVQLRIGPQGQARPQEIVQAVYGVPGSCFRYRRVELGVEASRAEGEAEAVAGSLPGVR
jgi:radical SAM family uncharacterized protein/radical SAM-linked protein